MRRVRFFACAAHLASTAGAGGMDVAEEGGGIGGDRGDDHRRADAVDLSRGGLGGTCART